MPFCSANSIAANTVMSDTRFSDAIAPHMQFPDIFSSDFRIPDALERDWEMDALSDDGQSASKLFQTCNFEPIYAIVEIPVPKEFDVSNEDESVLASGIQLNETGSKVEVWDDIGLDRFLPNGPGDDDFRMPIDQADFEDTEAVTFS